MLVFLDIDGVLVPAHAWKRPEFLADGFPAFSRRATQALAKILSATDAGIVLTTSHKSNYSISEWYRIFQRRGIPVHTLQRLAKNVDHANRRDEVLNWFHTHDAPDHFVIIDDDTSLHALPRFLKKNLVITCGSVGLTEELADEAIALLKADISPVLV